MISRNCIRNLSVRLKTFSRNYQISECPSDPLCRPAFLFYQLLMAIMAVHRPCHHLHCYRCNYSHSIVWFASFADCCSAAFCCCCCWCFCSCFWFVLWLIISIWSQNNCRSLFSLPFEQVFCRNSLGWFHDDTLNTCLEGLLDSNDVHLVMRAVVPAVVSFLMLHNTKRPTTPIKQNEKCLHSNFTMQ